MEAAKRCDLRVLRWMVRRRFHPRDERHAWDSHHVIRSLDYTPEKDWRVVEAVCDLVYAHLPPPLFPTEDFLTCAWDGAGGFRVPGSTRGYAGLDTTALDWFLTRGQFRYPVAAALDSPATAADLRRAADAYTAAGNRVGAKLAAFVAKRAPRPASLSRL